MLQRKLEAQRKMLAVVERVADSDIALENILRTEIERKIVFLQGELETLGKGELYVEEPTQLFRSFNEEIMFRILD
jgi:hypothetical protein